MGMEDGVGVMEAAGWVRAAQVGGGAAGMATAAKAVAAAPVPPPAARRDCRSPMGQPSKGSTCWARPFA